MERVFVIWLRKLIICVPGLASIFFIPFLCKKRAEGLPRWKITIISSALVNISVWLLGKNDENYPFILHHRQRQSVSAEISTDTFLMTGILH